jgi:hypothetical protein
MKPVSKLDRTVMSVALLSCLMLAASISAFAVPPNQVARLLTNPTITAKCCFPIGPTVQVIEPAAIAPVIVTWSVDYEVSAEFAFNLSVNGGPCLFYGPGDAPFVNLKGGTGLSNSSYQWFVLPGDGVLVKGKNTFTACAGGIGGPATIFFSNRTLSVEIGK